MNFSLAPARGRHRHYFDFGLREKEKKIAITCFDFPDCNNNGQNSEPGCMIRNVPTSAFLTHHIARFTFWFFCWKISRFFLFFVVSSN